MTPVVFHGAAANRVDEVHEPNVDVLGPGRPKLDPEPVVAR
jgi:hypothetical protein